MENPFTDEQKAELRRLLSNPLLQQACQHTLSCVWAGAGSPSTLEGAALAYKSVEGAQNAISGLFKMADVKKDFKVSSPRLNHTAFRV